MSSRLSKWVDWAIIDHMSQGITSSTDLKIANFVRVSPSMTEITLGVGGVGAGVLDKDSREGGGDPLSFCDLDADGIVVHH